MSRIVRKVKKLEGFLQTSDGEYQKIFTLKQLHKVYLPVLVGETVYKICPKCNDRHVNNCEHCAWSGCFPHGCDVGVGVYQSGSYENHTKQIIEKRVSEYNFFTVVKLWGIMYFDSRKSAEHALSEYNSICAIQDGKERYNAYVEWISKKDRSWLDGLFTNSQTKNN